MTWDEQLEQATSAWTDFCRSLERVGNEALADCITHDEIDLAEGLRYVSRLARLTLTSAAENNDAGHPYFWTALDPHRKMGGDNPQGLYLSAPINGTDTFRVRGTGGSARWVSIIVAQQGPPPFGAGLFLPDLDFRSDGSFEVTISRDRHDGNWLQTTERSTSILVRQFFPTPDDVTPMQLTIENLDATSETPPVFTLADAVGGVRRAQGMYSVMAPLMLGEMVEKGKNKNAFKTDIGDPTSTSGGVPGGNAVTARWALQPVEALVVRVTPPDPCAYWDVQVGNGWYESHDYRHHFSGLTCEGVHLEDDGAVVLVLSERDPGTANWLEAAGHREGHIAIRWQLTEDLPIPETQVVAVSEVAALSGLPRVSPAERSSARADLVRSFDARFC
jgi:hypothetical protein